jgi:hypothetical protein
MIEFMSGAITLGFVVAAVFFLRFWRRTEDRLFLAFAVGFFLLALNQGLAQWLSAADERVGYTYLLRVIGFIIILAAVIDKNVSGSRRDRFRG